MSVIMLDTKVYELILAKLKHYTQMEDSSDTIDYNHAIKYLVRGMSDEVRDEFISDLVKQWCELNELSYCIKYSQINDKEYKKIKLRGHASIVNINTYQFISYLECIKYQIELDTIGKKKLISLTLHELLKAHEYLEKILSSAKDQVIRQIPEYKICKWAEPITK